MLTKQESRIVQIGEIEETAVRLGFAIKANGREYITTGTLPFYDVTAWTEATPEQQIKLLQAKVKHGDATEADLELLSELMPLDNPELEVGEVYVTRTIGDPEILAVVRAEYGDRPSVGMSGNCIHLKSKEFFCKTASLLGTTRGYRKALPHEVAKLETAEKENGCEYQKPLVNELGTVIEAGKYYKSADIFGDKYIYKVESINIPEKKFRRGQKRLDIQGGKLLNNCVDTQLGSRYGRTAVPATPEEIAEFKKAEAKSKLPKFEVGKKYTVWLVTFDCSVITVITVTRVDYCCDSVTFKYKGKFGSYVYETQKISSEVMTTAAEVK